MNVDWKSPLKSDDYVEYRDEDFLKRLEILNKKLIIRQAIDYYCI